MAGLLDWFNDPQTQGMLGLSAGLLQAGGPNLRPTGIGQGLSQGLLMGSNLANDARRGQLMGLQGQAMQEQLATQKRTQAAIDALAQQIPEADRQRFLADPAGYLKTQNEGYTLSADQVRMQGGKQVAQGPQSVKYQDAGAFLIPINTQGQQVGPAVPKSVTPDAQANLGQRKFEFGNLSKYQGAQLGNDAARLGIDRQRLGLDAARAQFEMVPGAGGLTGRSAQEVAAAAAKVPATAQAQAAVDLPGAVSKADQAVALIDEMIKHPGLPGAVGATKIPFQDTGINPFDTGVLAGARFIPGTKEAGFQAYLNQVKGGAFLQAFETLKGGGQITEIEGRKATEAITRMDVAQNEAEFVKAARDYQDVIKKGVERARQKASGGTTQQPRVVDW